MCVGASNAAQPNKRRRGSQCGVAQVCGGTDRDRIGCGSGVRAARQRGVPCARGRCWKALCRFPHPAEPSATRFPNADRRRPPQQVAPGPIARLVARSRRACGVQHVACCASHAARRMLRVACCTPPYLHVDILPARCGRAHVERRAAALRPNRHKHLDTPPERTHAHGWFRLHRPLWVGSDVAHQLAATSCQLCVARCTPGVHCTLYARCTLPG